MIDSNYHLIRFECIASSVGLIPYLPSLFNDQDLLKTHGVRFTTIPTSDRIKAHHRLAYPNNTVAAEIFIQDSTRLTKITIITYILNCGCKRPIYI